MQKTKQKFRFVLQVLAIYRNFQKPVLVALGLLFLCQVLSLAFPLLFGQVVNGIIRRDPTRDIFIFVGIAFAIMIANLGLERIRCIYEARRLDFKVPKDVQERTLQKILSLSPGQNRGQNSGKMQAIVDKGEVALSRLAPLFLYELMPLVLRIVATAVALLILQFTIGLVVLVGILAHLRLTFYLEKKFKRKIDRVRDLGNNISQKHTEIHRNLFFIQSSSQEGRAKSEYGDQLKRNCGFNEKLWSKWFLFATTRILMQIFIQFTVLVMGILYVAEGWCSPGSLVVIIMWTERAIANLNHVSFLHRNISQASSAIEKYFAVMKIEAAVQEIPNPVRMTSFVGRIEFIDVSFRYPDYTHLLRDCERVSSVAGFRVAEQNKLALSKVSFIIEAGQKVAFVGHSGAGKSTLVSLILRAYDPENGQITIDGIDLRTLSVSDYRRSIGIVEQNVTLFDATLRENLLYGVPQGVAVSDECIASVMRAACMDQFRDRLTRGLETRLGENGVFLSGGERQRVGIGRALIKNPSVLVLDEATSSLDALNEVSIKRSIDAASEGRTTILIAHRLSTVRDADKIFVLEKGCIVGEGKHEKLLEECPVYRELVEHQLM